MNRRLRQIAFPLLVSLFLVLLLANVWAQSTTGGTTTGTTGSTATTATTGTTAATTGATPIKKPETPVTTAGSAGSAATTGTGGNSTSGGTGSTSGAGSSGGAGNSAANGPASSTGAPGFDAPYRAGLAGGLLVFTLTALYLQSRTLPADSNATDIVKMFGATLIVTMPVLIALLVVSDVDKLLAPIFGLYGTVAGYILGRLPSPAPVGGAGGMAAFGVRNQPSGGPPPGGPGGAGPGVGVGTGVAGPNAPNPNKPN
jgi:hypothetical protein